MNHRSHHTPFEYRCRMCCNWPIRCNDCTRAMHCSEACKQKDTRHMDACNTKCFCLKPPGMLPKAVDAYIKGTADKHRRGHLCPTCANQKDLDRISNHLCPICANQKNEHGFPVFFCRSLVRTLDVAYWTMWADAGADMCQRIHGKTLLEYWVDPGQWFQYMFHEELTESELNTFQELIVFYLARHPHIVLESETLERYMLRAPVPRKQMDFYSNYLCDYIRAVEYLLTDVLTVRALAPLVVRFLLNVK